MIPAVRFRIFQRISKACDGVSGLEKDECLRAAEHEIKCARDPNRALDMIDQSLIMVAAWAVIALEALRGRSQEDDDEPPRF